MMIHSHNQYCGTLHNKHNILCYITEAVAFVMFVIGAYATASLGSILDAITAGGH